MAVSTCAPRSLLRTELANAALFHWCSSCKSIWISVRNTPNESKNWSWHYFIAPPSSVKSVGVFRSDFKSAYIFFFCFISVFLSVERKTSNVYNCLSQIKTRSRRGGGLTQLFKFAVCNKTEWLNVNFLLILRGFSHNNNRVALWLCKQNIVGFHWKKILKEFLFFSNSFLPLRKEISTNFT